MSAFVAATGLRAEASIPRSAAESDEQDTESCLSHQRQLAVIVPVYNERATVMELLARLQRQPVVSQIVVVDDGSTDGTSERLDRWSAECAGAEGTCVESAGPACLLLRHPSNAGKGQAIRTALSHVRCDHVLIQDADLEYDPGDIPVLWRVMQSGTTECVYGSRYLNRPGLQRGRWINQTGIRVLNGLMRLLYGVTVTDEATCYKMFRTSDLHRMNLVSRRFEFCAEVTAKASRMGLRIADVMISYAPRSADAGKKLRWIDGVHCLWVLVKWRFVPLPPSQPGNT